MKERRKHKKLSPDKTVSTEQLTGTNLHIENKAGEKEAEFLKPGRKIKLAWRVTYKKK
jgi:hypothetical protein